jgi:hypothetical protein
LNWNVPQKQSSEKEKMTFGLLRLSENTAGTHQEENMWKFQASSEVSHASHACFPLRFPRHNDRILPWELLFLL